MAQGGIHPVIGLIQRLIRSGGTILGPFLGLIATIALFAFLTRGSGSFMTVYNWRTQGERDSDGPLKEFVVGLREAHTAAERAEAPPPFVEVAPPGRPTGCVPELWPNSASND